MFVFHEPHNEGRSVWRFIKAAFCTTLFGTVIPALVFAFTWHWERDMIGLGAFSGAIGSTSGIISGALLFQIHGRKSPVRSCASALISVPVSVASCLAMLMLFSALQGGGSDGSQLMLCIIMMFSLPIAVIAGVMFGQGFGRKLMWKSPPH